MSAAFCLTCNEQVEPTTVGTCPLGHPVSRHEEGPDTWVGHAHDVEAVEATPPSAEVSWHAMDVQGMETAPVGSLVGEANGNGNGNGRRREVEHLGTGLDEVSEDWADTPADWAAQASDDAPDWEAMDAAWPVPEPAPDTSDTDLLADLDLEDADAETFEPVSWAAPAVEEADWAAPAPDAGSFDEPAFEPSWDDEPVDALGLEVPSDVPAVEDAVPSAPPVDLTNFTARGKRVGEGSAKPARRKRRRKK